MTYTNPNPYAMQDAAHARALNEQRQHEIAEAFWDLDTPGWRTAEVDPEDRTLVDYTLVRDPQESVVAVPDFHVVPGAYA